MKAGTRYSGEEGFTGGKNDEEEKAGHRRVKQKPQGRYSSFERQSSSCRRDFVERNRKRERERSFIIIALIC